MARNDVTPKQLQFVQALFECRSVPEAARSAGISERTADRSLADQRVQQWG